MKKLILILAVITFIACLIAPLYLVLNGLPKNAEAWLISYVLLTGLSGGYITIFDIKS